MLFHSLPCQVFNIFCSLTDQDTIVTTERQLLPPPLQMGYLLSKTQMREVIICERWHMYLLRSCEQGQFQVLGWNLGSNAGKHPSPPLLATVPCPPTNLLIPHCLDILLYSTFLLIFQSSSSDI